MVAKLSRSIGETLRKTALKYAGISGPDGRPACDFYVDDFACSGAIVFTLTERAGMPTTML
jgi:hypothetical protein